MVDSCFFFFFVSIEPIEPIEHPGNGSKPWKIEDIEGNLLIFELYSPF